ncbi:MAG: RNA polymerase subunit sigma-70 [Gemmataceae bacterium]
MAGYSIKAIKELKDQLVRFAPVERLIEELDRAERLYAEIKPDKEYPYQYVCYRVTGYRPDSYPELVISGKELEHNLALLIHDLGERVPAVPVEKMPEPVLTLEQVSRDYNVSTKTISRWRDLGLVTRMVVCQGRRRLGIRQSLWQRFLDRNRAVVSRGSRFSQLSDEEREKIIAWARRMARVAPDRFTEICRRIARRLGRSPETIRYTIKRHDEMYPNEAIFPYLHRPLGDADKTAIFDQYQRGTPIETLAKRYHRARTTVYRVINEIRARRLLSKPLDYIYHPSFDDPRMEQEILAPMPGEAAYQAARERSRGSAPKDLPPELASLYEIPLLTREQEAHLFRQMNYLKYKAYRLRERIDPTRARASDLDRLEELMRMAQAVKDRLISANMRLVVSIVKRHAGPGDNFFELLSDGNVSLMRAVEKFDFSRGNKFSTYATWAIMKNFARSIPEERHRRARFLTGQEEVFESAADVRSDETEQVLTAERAEEEVNRLLSHLDERERLIIKLRHGLGADHRHTLEEVGRELGITKERVRQLEARTMSKLRTLIAAGQSELS